MGSLTEIFFRVIKAEDYPQILVWLQRPHVKRWWDDGDDTLEKVVFKYFALNLKAAK